MDEFKKFLKALGLMLAIMFTIIASAAGLNTGSIYAVAGLFNFGWLYFPIREIVRYFKARNAQKTSANGGIAPEKPQADNKTDKVKTNI